MAEKNSITYKHEIIEKYHLDNGGDLSIYLHEPTPDKVKKACVSLFKNELSRSDKLIFESFFGNKKKGTIKVEDIKKFDVDKFKPIVKFLKRKTKTPYPITLELISILVDFKPRPYSKYSKSLTPSPKINQELSPIKKESNTEKTKHPLDIRTLKKHKIKIIVFTIVAFLPIVLFYAFHPFKTEKASSTKQPQYKILASNLFSNIRNFKANTNPNISLTGLNYYSWQQQKETLIALDSMVVKLTLRNNSSQLLYIDRLILKTMKKTKIQKGVIKNSSLFLSSNPSIVINPNEVPTDYVYKIIKDDHFNHLPAHSETDITLTVKGINHKKNDLIYFKFELGGHTPSKPIYIENKTMYCLGFGKN